MASNILTGFIEILVFIAVNTIDTCIQSSRMLTNLIFNSGSQGIIIIIITAIFMVFFIKFVLNSASSFAKFFTAIIGLALLLILLSLF